MAIPASKPVQSRSLSCPNCGGTVALRGFGHSRSAVCIQCLSVIDPTTPELRILQRFDERLRVTPVLPLGTRGTWRGVLCEVIGFQVRTITVEGVAYSWHEYLLFNPYHGFRYLTLYNGHWNDVVPVQGVPTFTQLGGRKAATYGGRIYAHFQTAVARTSFVMGEFPWEVRVGETAQGEDYIAPPYILSSENSDNEMNWSTGEYVNGADVWKAFQLKGSPPVTYGVYANQPSPYKGSSRGIWMRCVQLCLVWLALFLVLTFSASDKEIYRHRYDFHGGDPGDHSLVTDVFTVDGHTSNLEVAIQSDLDNNWAYFSLALINQETGRGYDFGREISYYHGSDSDGSWSEGKAKDDVVLPRVPPGRYYLRVEPEMDAQASSRSTSGMNMSYEIVVKRDVPHTWLLLLALPLLFIPPAIVSARSVSFESRRWSESDYDTPVLGLSGGSK